MFYNLTFALTILLLLQEWLEPHLPILWTFHAYPGAIDPPSGQRIDHVIPSCLGMMLQWSITVYCGKDVWHSVDEPGADIVLDIVGKMFMATKVGK